MIVTFFPILPVLITMAHSRSPGRVKQIMKVVFSVLNVSWLIICFVLGFFIVFLFYISVLVVVWLSFCLLLFTLI